MLQLDLKLKINKNEFTEGLFVCFHTVHGGRPTHGILGRGLIKM